MFKMILTILTKINITASMMGQEMSFDNEKKDELVTIDAGGMLIPANGKTEFSVQIHLMQ